MVIRYRIQNVTKIGLEMVEILHTMFLEKLDTHPRTIRSTVSQHYRVGLDNIQWIVRSSENSI